MTLLDVVYAIGAIIAFFVNAYLLYRANQIFDHTNRLMEKQNEILAQQAGVDVDNPIPKTLSLSRYWPVAAMTLLTVLTWSAVGYDLYDRHHSPVFTSSIFDFDDRRGFPVVINYGVELPLTGAGDCHMDVNGDALAAYKSEYRMVLACFVTDGTQGILDASNLRLSKEYDIADGGVFLRAVFSDAYSQTLKTQAIHTMWLALLLLPSNVEPDQFKTLRQARNLKVRIPSVSIVRSLSIVRNN